MLASSPSTLADGVVNNSSLTNLYAALMNGGRITFDPKLTYNFTFEAPIPIHGSIVIDAGANASPVVFDGGNLTQLFTVCTNATLQIINASLNNGWSTNGGAILVQSNGSLIVNDCTFSGNQSPTGGAILNEGIRLIANNCTFSGNRSATGGAIFHGAGTLSATNCVFTGNLAIGPEGASGGAGHADLFLGGNGADGTTGGNGLGGAVYSLAPTEFHLCNFEANGAAGGNGGQGGPGGTGGSKGGNGGNGGAAGSAFGGAVYATNQLVLRDCGFAANTASGGNGGLGGSAGATLIPDSGMISTAGLSREGGGAQGGAIYGVGPILASGCTFANDAAFGGAGAAAFADFAGSGLPGLSGGPAYGGSISSSGTNRFLNCTFYANSVVGGPGGNGGDGTLYAGGEGGNGGAAFGGALWSQGWTAVTNCTFASGSAVGGVAGQGGASGPEVLFPAPGSPGGTGSAGGGNLAVGPGGTLALLNSIVAYSPHGGNAYGTLVDVGHNLSSDATCEFAGPMSLNNTDPQLGALDDYGGPTKTMPLLVFTDAEGCQRCNGTNWISPGIDAGVAVPGLDTDQRGVFRPQGMAPDIGAFESVALAGQVRQYDGTPFADVPVWLHSTFSPLLQTVTDSEGHWQIVAPPDLALNLGVYRVEPAPGLAVFAPAFSLIDLPRPANGSVTADFTEVLAMGQVWQSDGSPFTNVTVALVSGSATAATAVTDAEGRYRMLAPPDTTLNPGVYEVVPQAEGAGFVPAAMQVQLGNPRTSTGVDFPARAAVVQERQLSGSFDPQHRIFQVLGWAAAGRSFVVEATPALPAPFWQPLGQTTALSDGRIAFTDTNAWYFPMRFYRLVPGP